MLTDVVILIIVAVALCALMARTLVAHNQKDGDFFEKAFVAIVALYVVAVYFGVVPEPTLEALGMALVPIHKRMVVRMRSLMQDLRQIGYAIQDHIRSWVGYQEAHIRYTLAEKGWGGYDEDDLECLWEAGREMSEELSASKRHLVWVVRAVRYSIREEVCPKHLLIVDPADHYCYACRQDIYRVRDLGYRHQFDADELTLLGMVADYEEHVFTMSLFDVPCGEETNTMRDDIREFIISRPHIYASYCEMCYRERATECECGTDL
jgi:hypothetical protein